MKNKITVRLFGVFIIALSMLMIMGWVLDIPMLRNPLSLDEYIKLPTVLCFMFCGGLLFCIEGFIKQQGAFSLCIITSTLMLLLLTAAFSVDMMFGLETGLEKLVTSRGIPSRGEFPGSSSLITTINFLLLALIGVVAMIRLKWGLIFIRTVSWIILFISLIVLYGHVMGIRMLTSEVKGLSDSMSLYSVFLFIFISLGLLLISKEKTNEHKEKDTIFAVDRDDASTLRPKLSVLC